MSILAIFPASEPDLSIPEIVRDYSKISKILEGIGVTFERWDTPAHLSDHSSSGEILSAYAKSVDRIKKENNFQSADVVSLTPDNPEKEAFRGKFLKEHTHTDYEIRFFVDGCGLFYLHVENMIYGVLCEKGDLISVPANTTHWFDMGSKPFFKCIRLFTDPAGWVGHFTGSDISQKFPDYDEYCENIK
ncbi:MAG: cupin [Spirochaetia bacterium]|nr:cupin [Spirochaetia bacterium]